jgi:hypothetical protein
LLVDLVLDGTTGTILKRTDFQSKLWLDRVIGAGIAAHEGQPFGLAKIYVLTLATNPTYKLQRLYDIATMPPGADELSTQSRPGSEVSIGDLRRRP